MPTLTPPDLRRLMLRRCSLTDLENLAYDLGLDSDEERKSHLVRTILTWAEDHDQMDELLDQLRANRPDLFEETHA